MCVFQKCGLGVQEQSYLRIGLLLDSDINLVRQWLKRTGELHATYWICAFCRWA